MSGRAFGCSAGCDAGNAIVEFVFLGILAMIPLLYLVLAVFQVERNVFAATQAAREAGRAYATAADPAGAAARARYASELAFRDQGLDPVGLTVRYVPVAADCATNQRAAADVGSLAPGSEFAVCVSRAFRLPGVPGFLDARRNTVTGRFVVHIDRFRRTG